MYAIKLIGLLAMLAGIGNTFATIYVIQSQWSAVANTVALAAIPNALTALALFHSFRCPTRRSRSIQLVSLFGYVAGVGLGVYLLLT